jgi:hypothetical protein
MVNYECPNCHRGFLKKYNFDMHTKNKKKPCQPLHQKPPSEKILPPKTTEAPPKTTSNTPQEPVKVVEVVEDKKEKQVNACLYCGLIFTRKDALNRHMKDRCKVKKLQKEEKETILQLLIHKDKQLEKRDKQLEKRDKQLENQLEQIEELKKMIIDFKDQMEKQLSKVRVQNINKGVINNNYIMTQNKLVNFGSEDISKIKKDRLRKIIDKSGYPAIVDCFSAIHNNQEYPEGMNVYISDKSRNKGMIWVNGDWRQATVKKIFNTVMNKIDSYVKLSAQRIYNGEYNTEKDPLGLKILSDFKNRLQKYLDRFQGEDDTVSKKDCKNFEELVKDNMINEICNIKADVIKNYEKILVNVENNNKIENKAKKEKDIRNDMDNILKKIDNMSYIVKNTHPRIKNKFNNDSDNDLDESDEYDYDSNNDSESDNDFDESDDESKFEKKIKSNKPDDEKFLVLKKFYDKSGKLVQMYVEESEHSDDSDDSDDSDNSDTQ